MNDPVTTYRIHSERDGLPVYFTTDADEAQQFSEGGHRVTAVTQAEPLVTTVEVVL